MEDNRNQMGMRGGKSNPPAWRSCQNGNCRGHRHSAPMPLPEIVKPTPIPPVDTLREMDMEMRVEVTLPPLGTLPEMVKPLPPIGVLPDVKPVPPIGTLPENECGYCTTVAMAYVPMQQWGKVYEAEEGFGRGTIFPELDKPFMGKGACRK